MTADTDTDINIKIDQSFEAAEKFVRLYYEAFDKRRAVIGKLYMDTAVLVWNGNSHRTNTEIVKFLEALPESVHTAESFDAQPMTSEVTKGQTTITVCVSGTVKYTSHKIRAFTQNFMLTAQGTSWKIVTDCFRASE